MGARLDTNLAVTSGIHGRVSFIPPYLRNDFLDISGVACSKVGFALLLSGLGLQGCAVESASAGHVIVQRFFQNS